MYLGDITLEDGLDPTKDIPNQEKGLVAAKETPAQQVQISVSRPAAQRPPPARRPVSPQKGPNWLLIGGAGVAAVALFVFLRRRSA